MLGLHLVILLRLSNPIQVFLRLRTRKGGETGAEDYFCQLFVAFYRMDVKWKKFHQYYFSYQSVRDSDVGDVIRHLTS